MKILLVAFAVVLGGQSSRAQGVPDCTCNATGCFTEDTNPAVKWPSTSSCSPGAITNGKQVFYCDENRSSYDISGAGQSRTMVVRHMCIGNATVNAANTNAVTQTDLGVANTSNSYGGAYKTASVSTTNAVNETAQVLTAGVNQVSQGRVNNAGAAAQENLANQGTAAAAAQGTANTLNADASAQTTAGMTKMGVSMLQLYRAEAHSRSVGTLNNQVGPAQLKCHLNSATEADCLTNITKNQLAETAVQKEEATKEAILAAGTGMSAVSNFQQASADRAAAAAALNSAGSGFAFNPGTGSGYTDGGSASDPTAAAGEVLASTGAADAGPGGAQVNPGLDPSAPGIDGRLGAGAPAAPAGPASGGGVQTAAATTAGKDDSGKKDDTAPGKQSAGSYGDANGPPAGFNRIAGTPPVGMDNSFADMLKKFLPGGDEDKKKDGDLNFNDRMPASDAAAVIPRNKNIFEEVTKRYKKKSSEGAVVFSI